MVPFNTILPYCHTVVVSTGYNYDTVEQYAITVTLTTQPYVVHIPGVIALSLHGSDLKSGLYIEFIGLYVCPLYVAASI